MIVNLGQAVHYIQAWKIFRTKSSEDISLAAYILTLVLIVHWLFYGIHIKNKVLVLAEFLGIFGCILVIFGIYLYG